MGVQFQGSSTTAGAPNLEAGIYDARFDGVEPVTLKESKFGNGDCFEWQFTLTQDGEVLYDEGEPIKVKGLSSRSMNLKSQTVPRAVKYLRALLAPAEQAKFAAEQPIDEDELVGRPCQVIVVIKDSGWPQVDDVLPAPKKKASPAARATAA